MNKAWQFWLLIGFNCFTWVLLIVLVVILLSTSAMLFGQEYYRDRYGRYAGSSHQFGNTTYYRDYTGRIAGTRITNNFYVPPGGPNNPRFRFSRENTYGSQNSGQFYKAGPNRYTPAKR